LEEICDGQSNVCCDVSGTDSEDSSDREHGLITPQEALVGLEEKEKGGKRTMRERRVPSSTTWRDKNATQTSTQNNPTSNPT